MKIGVLSSCTNFTFKWFHMPFSLSKFHQKNNVLINCSLCYGEIFTVQKILIVLLNIYGLWKRFVRGCCDLENHSYQLNCYGSLTYVYEVGGHHVLSNTFQRQSTSTSKSIEGYVLLDISQSGSSTPTFMLYTCHALLRKTQE